MHSLLFIFSMKHFAANIILVAFAFNSFSQNENGNELLSPKPRISINGIEYNIGYGNQSCVPKDCDSVIINAGDSIIFCSVPYFTELNVPGYYLQWDFAGSNMPTLLDTAPAVSPICYSPEWNAPGNYMVNIYYQGALSVSTCNSIPSQWFVKVIVLPQTGIEETEKENILFYPNPSNGILRITNVAELQITNLEVYNVMGEEVYKSEVKSQKEEINLSTVPKGIYFVKVIADEKIYSTKVVIE